MINSSACAEARRRRCSLRMCYPQAAASPSSAAALEASEVRVQPHSNAQHRLAHMLTEDMPPDLGPSRRRSRRSSCSTVFDQFGMAAVRPRAQYVASSSRSSQQQSRCFCTSWSGAGFASCSWVAAQSTASAGWQPAPATIGLQWTTPTLLRLLGLQKTDGSHLRGVATRAFVQARGCASVMRVSRRARDARAVGENRAKIG